MATAVAAHSQSNSSVVLDEVDTAGEASKYDHAQQPQQSYTGLQDHVITFQQSQSDPINRGPSTYLVMIKFVHRL